MRHKRFLELATLVARSNPNTKHKHAAILVKGGRILGVGQNTDQAVSASSHATRHAEESAFRYGKDLYDEPGILYVAKISRVTHDPSLSRPCDNCLQFLLEKTRIKKVFWTETALTYKYIDLNKERHNG